MTFEATLKKYLGEHEIMQLATSSNNQPWCCSLHYVIDDNLTFYWLSFDTRRHSQDIAANPKAALAVAVQTAMPVIGIQAEGIATRVTNQAEVTEAATLYNQKIINSQDWLTNYLAGNDDGFKVYKLVPSLFVLFDRKNFDIQGARHEWRPRV